MRSDPWHRPSSSWGTHYTAKYGADVVVEISFGSIEELDEFVFDRLRKIPHVKETVTVICSEIMS